MSSLLSNLTSFRPTIVLYLFLGFLFGFVYRWIAKTLFVGSVRGVTKNIKRSGRRMRAAAGLGLLIWAVSTTMNPWLLFFAGFCFFEAIFSRCGFYAAIGKSSCPIN